MSQLTDKDKLHILMDSIKVEAEITKELQKQNSLEKCSIPVPSIPQPIFINKKKESDNISANIREKYSESKNTYLDNINAFRYLFPNEYRTNVEYFRKRLQRRDAIELLEDISFGYQLISTSKQYSSKLYTVITKLKSLIIDDIRKGKLFSLLNYELETFGEIVDITKYGMIFTNELLPIDIFKEDNIFRIKDVTYIADNVLMSEELTKLYEIILAFKFKSLFHSIKYASIYHMEIVEDLLKSEYPTLMNLNLLFDKNLIKMDNYKYFKPEEEVTLLLLDSFNFMEFLSRYHNGKSVELPMAKISELNRKSLLLNIPDEYSLYLHNNTYPFIETLILQEDLQIVLDDYENFRKFLESPTQKQIFTDITKFICDSINMKKDSLKFISYLINIDNPDLDTIEVSNTIDLIGLSTSIKIGIGNKECITAVDGNIQRFTWNSNIGRFIRDFIALSKAIKEKDILSILQYLSSLNAKLALRNTHDLLKKYGCELPEINNDNNLVTFYKKLNPNYWLNIPGFNMKEIINYDTSFSVLDYKLLLLVDDREVTTYLYKKYIG